MSIVRNDLDVRNYKGTNYLLTENMQNKKKLMLPFQDDSMRSVAA